MVEKKSSVTNGLELFCLLGDELYAGVATDLMGRDFTIFRSLGKRPSIRTEQHDSRWLNGLFVSTYVSPKSGLFLEQHPNHPGGIEIWHCPLCLPEPKFVGSFLVPESENPDDDKVFFFFRETAVEAQGLGKSTYSRIGQLCRVRHCFITCVLYFK